MMEGQTAGRARKPLPYVLGQLGIAHGEPVTEVRAKAILEYLGGKLGGVFLRAECERLERNIYA